MISKVYLKSTGLSNRQALGWQSAAAGARTVARCERVSTLTMSHSNAWRMNSRLRGAKLPCGS